MIDPADLLPQPHPNDHPDNAMWLDEKIWGHRLWDNQSPWLVFLECLNLAEACHRDGRLLNHGTNYYPLNYRPQQRLHLRNLLFNNEALFQIAERNRVSASAWKEWLKWMDDNAKGISPRDFSYLQERFHSFDNFAALVGMLRASAVEAETNKRWSSRFVFPFGQEALYEDLNVTATGTVSREYINFGRTGELLYMMLARSPRAGELVQVFKPMLDGRNPWNTLLKLLQPTAAGDTQQRGRSFLPYARHSAFDRLAEDWLAIEKLRLPGFDAYPHLVTLSAFGVLLYELEVATEWTDRARPSFICEVVGPKKTLVRELSTQNYQENNLLPENALKTVIRRIEESDQWKQATQDHAAFVKCKEILIEQFRWPADEEDYDNCSDPESLLNEFRKKAIARHRQHLANVHRNYGRDVGLVSKRGTNRLRYAPNDNLLKALILANVEWRMEFNEFLERLCDRYGLIFGGINDPTHIVVIDDAYDPPTTRDFPSLDAAAEFIAAVRKHNGAKAELAAITPAKEAADINDQVVLELWNKYRDGELKDLHDPCKEFLFKAKDARRADVEKLRAHLQNLGFDSQPLGSRQDPPVEARLVFLDYVLDQTRTMELDELATEKAVAIYSRAANGNKPFIVLISDRPDAASQRETFREKSKLLGGLFGFMSKADAGERDRLYMLLGSWGIGNPTNQKLQRFVDAVVEAADSAASSFKARVRALGVQDYGFIQRLSLHADGHPLGDYVMGLFEASLGSGLRSNENVVAEEADLDKLRFDSYLPCQSPPSERLTEFFVSAVTEPAIREIGAHPHASAEDRVPLLHLGDVFLKASDNTVCMVLTTACDLAFSPAGGRKYDPLQAVSLLPGYLQSMEEHGDDNDVRTELLLYHKKAHRIVWKCEHMESKNLASVWGYLEGSGFKRVWRLRLPYALTIQQEVSSRSNRIGMPVVPPLFSQADVSVFCKGEDGKTKQLGGNISGGAVLIGVRDSDKYVLTVDCISAIMQRVAEAATELELNSRATNSGSSNSVARLEASAKKVQWLRECGSDSNMWLALMEKPRPLPKAGQRDVLDAKLLWVYRDGDLSGDYAADKVPLTLNIVTASLSASGVPSAEKIAATGLSEAQAPSHGATGD